LGYGWVFLKILGFGWVWVFAAPVWVGFRFLFFKKPGFRLGFGFFFQNLKKWKIPGKIVKKEKKSKKIIIQTYCKAFCCSGGKNLGSTGSTKNQPKSMVDGQPVQHKIVRLLNAGPRPDPTDLWQAGPKSVDDGF
jgi:hypothetical protein